MPDQHETRADHSATKRARLPGISHRAFQSQMDEAALTNLQRLPLLPLLIRKFNEHALDRLFYSSNSAESVRCGPRQFPTLHRMLQEGCAILDVPEPELYVRYSPVMNAYTAGVNRTFIVLHSALLNSLGDDELLYVIGHELGHIKCGHVLYQMVGAILVELLEYVGQSALGLGYLARQALVIAFFEWMRQAEFSSDRAGVLVCQDPSVALNAIMKMGCGSSRFDDERNLDAFMEQARTHQEMVGADRAAKAIAFMLYNHRLSHPQSVYRAKGLDQWVASGTYQRILDGEYLRDTRGTTQMGPQKRCPICRTKLSVTVVICPGCATNLDEHATGQHAPCSKCGVMVPAGMRYCMDCGTPATGYDEEPI